MIDFAEPINRNSSRRYLFCPVFRFAQQVRLRKYRIDHLIKIEPDLRNFTRAPMRALNGQATNVCIRLWVSKTRQVNSKGGVENSWFDTADHQMRSSKEHHRRARYE
jgi:hypothetical protein